MHVRAWIQPRVAKLAVWAPHLKASFEKDLNPRPRHRIILSLKMLLVKFSVGLTQLWLFNSGCATHVDKELG